MLPISQSALCKVEMFLQFEYDDEQRERMGAYFLWLEEKSLLHWDTPSVYLAYQHCLNDEEQLDEFLDFYQSLESVTDRCLGLYGVVVAFFARRGLADSLIEKYEYSEEDIE